LLRIGRRPLRERTRSFRPLRESL